MLIYMRAEYFIFFKYHRDIMNQKEDVNSIGELIIKKNKKGGQALHVFSDKDLKKIPK
jgi:hypothetical protein